MHYYLQHFSSYLNTSLTLIFPFFQIYSIKHLCLLIITKLFNRIITNNVSSEPRQSQKPSRAAHSHFPVAIQSIFTLHLPISLSLSLHTSPHPRKKPAARDSQSKDDVAFDKSAKLAANQSREMAVGVCIGAQCTQNADVLMLRGRFFSLSLPHRLRGIVKWKAVCRMNGSVRRARARMRIHTRLPVVAQCAGGIWAWKFLIQCEKVVKRGGGFWLTCVWSWMGMKCGLILKLTCNRGKIFLVSDSRKCTGIVVCKITSNRILWKYKVRDTCYWINKINMFVEHPTLKFPNTNYSFIFRRWIIHPKLTRNHDKNIIKPCRSCLHSRERLQTHAAVCSTYSPFKNTQTSDRCLRPKTFRTLGFYLY